MSHLCPEKCIRIEGDKFQEEQKRAGKKGGLPRSYRG